MSFDRELLSHALADYEIGDQFGRGDPPLGLAGLGAYKRT